MRIKTRLKVAALAPLLMTLIVGVAIWFAHGAMRMAQERGRTAARIIQSMNDLHSLVGLYALHHEQRTRQQFLAEHNTAAQLLAAAAFDDPEQTRLLTALRENTDTIRDIFLRTVALHERRPSRPEAEALGRDENRLMGQLLVHSRQAVADGLRLDKLVDDEIVAIQHRADLLIIFLILIVTLPLTLLLARMMNRIARGLATLRQGTQVVGAGDLAHRIRLSGEDELANFGQAFDQMTENLQAVSVSRKELEGEVEVRRRTEAALQESETRLVADLDAMTRLQKLGTLFVREDNLEPVLGEIVDAAIAISGADFGNIQLLDPKSAALKIAAQRGFPQWWIDFWNGVSEGRGACGTALESGERVIVEDVEESPIFIGTPALDIQLKAGVRAVQSTPLVSRSGRLLGMFSTHYKRSHRPDDRTLRLLDLLAQQAADIIERARSEEALRASDDALRQANEQLEQRIRERTAELVALSENLMESRDQLRSLASDLILTEAREKKALALELHDTVAQMLAIAKMTLESTGGRLEGKSREEVKRVVQILQEASRQTRSLMADLSPSLLYEAELGQALRALAQRIGELHALAIEVIDDGSPKPLGEDYRILLFRAVQELLHNVVKHAKATNVKVSLQREDTQMRIEVEDDGVGFLVSERGRGKSIREGFGLFSITERLQHLEGRFEIFSQPGRGVRAVLVVPLQVEGKGEGREPARVRVLIAEDHRMMRDSLASLLEKEPGFEIVGLAADGLEAVRLSHEVKPDVVLMDRQMPRMDGIEATRQIRAELPEIKVIGLSVQSAPQIASQMLAAGATSFVPKSSSPEELTEAIRTAVGVGKRN